MPILLEVTKEVRRSTGHIMVTTSYSNQQGSKSRRHPCQVLPTENIGVKTLSLGTDYSFCWLEGCQYVLCWTFNKVIESDTRSFLALEAFVTHRQVIRHFTSNGTAPCQNGLSNLLIPYREQPRSTRIVVAYPRPAFSTTMRTNHAPVIFG